MTLLLRLFIKERQWLYARSLSGKVKITLSWIYRYRRILRGVLLDCLTEYYFTGKG